MWPRDRGRAADVVRIGAHALELWSEQRAGLRFIAAHPLPRRGSLYEVGGLVDALGALGPRIRPAGALVVLESAFVPVQLVDTGGSLVRIDALKALLRHRFELTYAGSGTDVGAWTLRTDHRFGRRHALAYAVPDAVAAALRAAARSIGLTFGAWVSALPWSLDRFDPSRRWPRRTGGWAWPEQDRVLLAVLQKGRVQGLNPAARTDGSLPDIRGAIAVECSRIGVDGTAWPLGIGRWRCGEPSPPAEGLDRFVVEAPDRSSIVRPLKDAA